ncbi:M20 family metallopeptidase [Alsobacter sp. SYSU M60028]|uniref:M20 family metallopeptidase n=1 Tax=Alsobacter ponti TaxID=2962936 RepID=A0ABT1LGT8_9HYPH|nr:M20 family metallopeptidase [Alsobacter ponti]MCP8940301.1 M20 family metallopeptidase [Alsobacter ponti]
MPTDPTPLPLPRLVEGISRWAEIESPTHDAAAVNACLDAVEREVAGAPVALERLPGRDGLGDMLVLRAGPRTEAPGVLVMSHLDTVHPVGTLARDLPVRVEGDRLYGPGVYDMKGGAYLALRAFLSVAAEGSARLPLTFLFTPDEEIGSPISRPVIEDFARRSAYALVTEPGRDGGKVVTGRKGVGRFDVRLEGRPSHAGSRHQDGRSAIREAARQILDIEAMTDYGHGVTTTVGMMQGGTAANVVPQHAGFCVDLRVVTAKDGEDYAARILGLRPHDPDVRIAVTGGMNRPPYEKDDKVEALFAVAHALARADGVELLDVPLTGGGSDGNFTAALGVPTLDGLGIDGDGAHTLQEYGLISSILPRMRLMEGLLRTLG